MANISFVFPLYNEEEALPFLINQIRNIMITEPDDYEMIFVNDASSDNSAKVIADSAIRKGKEKIVLVNMSRRFGVEESFLAGIQAAQGDAVILMYTDLQDPPEVISKMLQHFREGAEIVHSIRRKRIGEHPLKNIAAFIAYRIIGKMAETKIPYDSGEFKLLSRNVAKHLLNCPEVEPYLRGLIPWIGFKQTYVEYEMQPRVAGKRKVSLFGKKAWTVFLNGIISFSDSPIYMIIFLGFISVIISVASILLFVTFHDFNLFNILIATGIFLWATLMFAVGILSFYVLKIYKNTRGRPRYIVKEVIKL